MNTDNHPTPDDSYRKAWQQAFDGASEAPPPRVWSAIERQLDADNRANVIPLWARVRPWATGIAATLALVLTGWWTWQELAPTSPAGLPSGKRSVASVADEARVTAVTPRQPRIGQNAGLSRAVAPTSPARIQPGVRETSTADGLATVRQPAGQQATVQLAPASQLNNQNTDVALVTPVETRKQEPTDAQRSAPSTTVSASPDRAQPTLSMLRPALVSDGRAVPVIVEPANTSPVAAPVEVALTDRPVMSVDALTGKTFRNRVVPIQRVVWFRNEELMTPTSVLLKSVKRQKWVSASIVPSSFNPVLALHQATTALPSSMALYDLSTALVTTKSQSLRSEPGRAIAMQVSAGTQLSNRWSVEAGVGYLQAQSTVVSPVQTAQAMLDKRQSTYYTTVVQNALARNGTSANSASSSFVPNYYSTNGEEAQTRNDYTFVQIPVQVGYQLRPRRKLGLSVLGGLLSNWFVRNAVGETLVVKPADNVYRSLTLAGTAGARFRYRSSRRWSASLAGVYQQSLQLGTQSDVSLETRPHTVGVSFGMDYHF